MLVCNFKHPGTISYSDEPVTISPLDVRKYIHPYCPLVSLTTLSYGAFSIPSLRKRYITFFSNRGPAITLSSMYFPIHSGAEDGTGRTPQKSKQHLVVDPSPPPCALTLWFSPCHIFPIMPEVMRPFLLQDKPRERQISWAALHACDISPIAYSPASPAHLQSVTSPIQLNPPIYWPSIPYLTDVPD